MRIREGFHWKGLLGMRSQHLEGWAVGKVKEEDIPEISAGALLAFVAVMCQERAWSNIKASFCMAYREI